MNLAAFKSLWAKVLAIMNSKAAWQVAVAACAAEVGALILADDAIGAAYIAKLCIAKISAEYVVLQTYPAIKHLLGLGGGNMACVTEHNALVQGPGVCCQQVQSGALKAAAGVTTLPIYVAGYNWATNPDNYPHVMVTDAGGHCATCAIVGSRSKKKPGHLALHYQRGGPGCPITSRGCCALTAL